jgi:hypothetical protein
MKMEIDKYRTRLGLIGSYLLIVGTLLPAYTSSYGSFHVIENEAGILIAFSAVISIFCIKRQKLSIPKLARNTHWRCQEYSVFGNWSTGGKIVEKRGI